MTDAQKNFRDAKFGMMIHWGLYSLLAGEYRGQRMDYIGEWIQSKYEIPNAEYEKLAEAFLPLYFNADEWVLLAKAAGMEYIVVTAKHHEGFCLFDSAYDDYNTVRGTPMKRDVIGELADACRRHGLKLGLYYSQDLDWHEKDGGGYFDGKTNFGMSWTNSWDFPDTVAKDYSRYFRAKVLPQVKELLTKYGDIFLVWFDTPMTISAEESKELFSLVKRLQPNCLVNTRIGNGLGDYTSMGDNEIPDCGFEMPAESPTTLNDTWGYKSFDENWKDAEKVLAIKKHLNDRGVNYLLNVGPDAMGRIPAPAEAILRRVGELSKKA